MVVRHEHNVSGKRKINAI